MQLVVIIGAIMFWIGVNRICEKLENIETALLMQSMELKMIRQGTELE